ncbi:coenzyme F420-0:L-glutamate ligase [Candidatus Kaiserbacteria bacterium]|nr:coenzyme F420-0:L-glutamate ligase [Candidatus Kaiserbacteria bacterium]
MQITPIQTRKLQPPQDDLLAVLKESIKTLSEKSVVAVSSKVVALWQGRCIKIDESNRRAQKEALIKEEADRYLEKDPAFLHSRLFTIYEGVFTSSAGIDESNGNGYFVLLPKDAAAAAAAIRAFLIERYAVTELGVVIVDSRTMPMRNGVVGVSLGHAGFKALYDYRETEDIFGRKLKFERLNVADALATAATLALGEGSECTPLALCADIPHCVFLEEDSEDALLTPKVPLEHDVFAQFLAPHPWKQKS